MKKTKLFLVSALIFAGLTFTGCNNGTSNGNGETGGSGSGTEDSKVIQLSEDGKTVTIDYKNETEEEQRFFVYAGENLGYNFRGKFELYEQETDSPYEFGMLFDFNDDKTYGDWFYNIFKLNVLNKNNDNETQYKYVFGQSLGVILEEFNNVDFSSFTYESNTINKTIILGENNVDRNLVFLVREENNKIIASTQEPLSFKLLDKMDGSKKFCYYLIIPAGSTCHLKLTISDL